MLEEVFQELNQSFFRGELPPIVLIWNSRLSCSAGRFSPGLRSRTPARIEVASYLKGIAGGPEHIRDTLLHEMIHYFLWWKNRPYGHTPEFKALMRRFGAQRYNTVPKQKSFKHRYKCFSCHRSFPTRKILPESACFQCCKTKNKGKFSKEFLLVKVCLEDISQIPATPTAPAQIEKLLSPLEIIGRLESIKRIILQARKQ